MSKATPKVSPKSLREDDQDSVKKASGSPLAEAILVIRKKFVIR